MINERTIKHARHILEKWPALQPTRELIKTPNDYIVALARIIRFIELSRQAWEAHPDYARCSKESKQDPADPVVQGWFRHKEPGLGQATHSWVFDQLSQVSSPATVKWGKRSIGVFERVTPIDPDFEGISTRFQTIYSLSLHGSNQPFYARKVLRALLPKRLGPLITNARQIHSKPKYWMLRALDTSFNNLPYEQRRIIVRTPSMQPEWYRNTTKAELWPRYTQYQHLLPLLQRYMDPVVFYQAATGEIHPDDIPKYVQRQLSLFEDQS